MNAIILAAVTVITSTEGNYEQVSDAAIAAAPSNQVVLTCGEPTEVFNAWGTTFNELDYDALRCLPEADQETLLRLAFDPAGDLRFMRGRISMNANDYARAWYSCDETDGDFALRDFNIEHDKTNIIAYIRRAQKYQPRLGFWVSPWSPPTWMKLNRDYCVLSSKWNHQPKEKDALLYSGAPDAVDPNEMWLTGSRTKPFPRKLATKNYFIMEPKYLQAYADMFVKFIELYRAEGIDIDMAMYQNEAYSYTPYPGCPWTAEGTIRFNRDYFAPTLRKRLPGVKVGIGTFNTNRRSYVDQILSAEGMDYDVMGFQWEGVLMAGEMKDKHHRPFICSEAECGNGRMDWKGAEHTFYVLYENLRRGACEWYNWNYILCGNGCSPWGWKQNALVQVDPHAHTYRLTPEYYAVKHHAHWIQPGAKRVGATAKDHDFYGTAYRNPDGTTAIVLCNASPHTRAVSVQLAEGRFVNLTFAPHSFKTVLVPVLTPPPMLQPTIYADVPDVAPLRVGDRYYMTSTTMHFNPGVPVLTSTNLVDWTILSYCYDTVEDRPRDRLEPDTDRDGKPCWNDYGLGTWASSIRYDAATRKYYISVFNAKAEHTYLFSADDPKGPWEKRVYDQLVYDHSLWIEDGHFYLFGMDHRCCSLYRLKDDLSAIEKNPKVLIRHVTDCVPGGKGMGEGCQVFKRNGWYYIVNICWQRGHCRLVAVHRSRHLEGPYNEGRVVFEHQGIAQGSFLEKTDGDWVAVLFADRGAVGRCPFVLPVRWVDDWPVVEPTTIDAARGGARALPGVVSSDEFDYPAPGTPHLSLNWQFNHNPDPDHWSLTERPGYFRLTTSRVDPDLLHARNTFTMRTFGPTCTGETKLDITGLKVGDIAGLAAFQDKFGFVAVNRRADGDYIVVANHGRVSDAAKLPEGTKEVELQMNCDFTQNEKDTDFTRNHPGRDLVTFAYRVPRAVEDAGPYQVVGSPMRMPYTIPHFTGYRFALFDYATKEVGGHADFDYFRVGL